MDQDHKRLNICIVSHNAYGAIKGGSSGHAGGVEHQTSMLASWLATRGHKVSLLTWDEGTSEEEIIDDVRVIKMCRQDEGLPGIRFFSPRWSSLNRAMRNANADLYYHNCAEYVTGQVALWCKLYGRRFIFSIASDAECKLESPVTEKLRDRVLYQYGLRRTAQVIVQTKKQQQLLYNSYGLDSVVLPMPCPVPVNDENQNTLSLRKEQQRVIWVGRFNREKRLELLLDIAEALPHVIFEIAGKSSNPEEPYYRNLIARAEKIDNVKILGMVPRNQMPNLYKRASLLCNTSLYEGFPNTFLEAWSYGLPIVSTFDPDNLISDKKLGIYTEKRDELISGIKNILESKSLWQEMSANGERYFKKHHSLDQAMQRFENVFLKV